MFTRKNKALISLITTLLLLGCNSDKKKNRTEQILVGNLSIVLPPNTSEQNKEYILEAAKIHLDEFEKDYGAQTKFSVVTVVEADLITCGSVQNAIGCYSFPSDAIRVTAGDSYELPALYHELWHLNSPFGDINHEHPDWPTRTAKTFQIAESISLARNLSLVVTEVPEELCGCSQK